MEVVMTTRAIRRANYKASNHHQQMNIQFFYKPDAFLPPNQQCQNTEGNINKCAINAIGLSSTGIWSKSNGMTNIIITCNLATPAPWHSGWASMFPGLT